MPGQLKIDDAWLAVFGHEPVRFLGEIIVNEIQPVQGSKKFCGSAKIRDTGRSSLLHRFSGDPASLQRIGIDMQDLGNAGDAIHGSEGTGLASQETPREPPGPGAGPARVAQDSWTRIVQLQRYFAEYVFFQ